MQPEQYPFILKKKVAFHTLGCKLNFTETSTIARSFNDSEYERVSPGSHADVHVINTCTVTGTADRKCRQAIRKIINNDPGAFVAVVGCYAQLRTEDVAAIEGVDLVLGTYEKFNLASYIDNHSRKKKPEIHSCEAVDSSVFLSAWSAGDRTRTFLKVQDGCDNRCSYCTVPLARGKSRNPYVSEVVEQARLIVTSGVKEIVITGVNVGDFGKSTGESPEELLEALLGIRGLERIRLSSVEPDLLNDGLISMIAADPRLMPHIHMPLQSGCDRILGLMRRRYRRELFRDRVMAIREKIPSAGIGADVIVGFPGETEHDFMDTYRFIEDLPLSYLHVFAFSSRPGTPAAEMPDHVKKTVAEHRSRELIKLSEKKRITFMRNEEGTVRDVLLEKKNTGGMITGLTGNYIRVVTPWSKELPGTIRKVKLISVRDNASMTGEIKDAEE